MMNRTTSTVEDPLRSHDDETAFRRARGGFSRTPAVDRLLRRCALVDGCLVWQGAKRPGGYGVIGVVINGRHVVKSTHRVAYEALVGPIPAGYHIDHLCKRRDCVSPYHLEAVPQAINNRRIHKRHGKGDPGDQLVTMTLRDYAALLTGTRPDAPVGLVDQP